jgi:hypothetical protein
MPETPRPQKRRCSESDSVEECEPDRLLMRSTCVWYNDGNLVLQAENLLFKVHRDVLAARSEVFKNMLSLPQPENAPRNVAENVAEECPVVQLPDEAEDIRHALKAIYGDKRCVTSLTDSGLDFYFICAAP